MTERKNPVARKASIVVQNLANETLVYDILTNKALCLNQTSALVWQELDGKKSVEKISRLVSKKTGQHFSEDMVWLALNQLKNENLLADGKTVSTPFDGMTRREIVKRVGFASIVALPVISSLIAPRAALAGTGACAPIGNCTGGGGGPCVCNPIMQPGNNNNPGGCPCATAGDCIGGCTCSTPCEAGVCPPGEQCQGGICFDGQNPGSQADCSGSCPAGQTCNPDGSCSGVCQGAGVCDGPVVPLCFPGNTSNLSADCCPCSNVEGCVNCCNDGVCGPCVG